MNVASGQGGFNETRNYNTISQLAGLTASENLTDDYPTGANNGKIASKYDSVTGETVTCYDAQNKRNFSWNGTLDPLNNRDA